MCTLATIDEQIRYLEPKSELQAEVLDLLASVSYVERWSLQRCSAIAGELRDTPDGHLREVGIYLQDRLRRAQCIHAGSPRTNFGDDCAISPRAAVYERVWTLRLSRWCRNFLFASDPDLYMKSTKKRLRFAMKEVGVSIGFSAIGVVAPLSRPVFTGDVRFDPATGAALMDHKRIKYKVLWPILTSCAKRDGNAKSSSSNLHCFERR